MAAATNDRFATVLVLITLACCAFFLAQGATALISEKISNAPPGEAPLANNRTVATPSAVRRYDPNVILRRNIFDSSQGDLTDAPVADPSLPEEELPPEEVDTPCKGNLRLVGTVVLPGDFERSLAAIVGTDQKVALHQGGAEVEGSRIRAIQSDRVILQNKAGFCRLKMFQVESGPGGTPIPPPVASSPSRRPARPSLVDRNAGLSDEELAEGIEKINDTNFNLSRVMFNKVLDNAGKLIGIAAVTPKMENGQSVGMEIRGIRAGTLLTKLGLENGDILESVNGQSLTTADAALGAYTTLRTSEKFSLSVRRNGKPMIINYNLQ